MKATRMKGGYELGDRQNTEREREREREREKGGGGYKKGFILD